MRCLPCLLLHDGIAAHHCLCTDCHTVLPAGNSGMLETRNAGESAWLLEFRLFIRETDEREQILQF